MSKILLANFPQTSQKAGLQKLNGKGSGLHIRYGFDRSMDRNAYIHRTRSDLLTSLLIHDKSCMEIAHVGSILEAFGFKDTIRLLREACLEIIDDKGLQPILVGDGTNHYETGIAKYGSEEGTKSHDSFQRLEESLLKDLPTHKSDIRVLLLQAEANAIHFVNLDAVGKTILSELEYDLKNANLTHYLNIGSPDRQTILLSDMYKVLRLLYLNTSMIYAIEAKADSLSIEGGIRSVLPQKLSPAMRSAEPPQSVEVFTRLLSDKKIPDLATLYAKRLLTIDDILELRTSFHGRRFREWFHSKDYDSSLVHETLLTQKSGVRSQLVKVMRWTVPAVIGLVDSWSGVAASLLEGFIVDKILKGWHPLFFLDDQLKARIDERISHYEESRKDFLRAKWFPGLKGSDECPCGSGNRFADCCGR